MPSNDLQSKDAVLLRGAKLFEYRWVDPRLSLGMKTILVTVTIALAGVSASHAQQLFRPSVGSGAVVGAVAGGLIGGHNGDRWAQGAVIGAAAGALIGAALRPPEVAYQPPVYQSPVYQNSGYGQAVYGQTVYSQPSYPVATAPVISHAPMVPMAPTLSDYSASQVVHAPPQVVYMERSPQVVYVERAPQVVYVPAPPRVVYVRPPVVSFGFYSGPRYAPAPRYVPRYAPAPVCVPAPRYGHGHDSHHGHGSRGRDDDRHRGSGRR